ncbi:hypothetical protein LWI28_005452 [Acer negundo]|uniref:Uncharacterized protein n=1 Tax=Acer negundo TaxID=4023 RepID=A0AAD5NWI6_ACENE|nr:hypothetical protein LWI28_005452 [Acer negundo]
MCLRLVLVQLLLLIVANAALTTTQLAQRPKLGCPSTCGELELIQYPFGTEPDCYLNEDFFINCKIHNNTPTPFLGNSSLVVTNITMDGRFQVQSNVSRACYNENTSNITTSLEMDKNPISVTQNKFTVIGCDSLGIILGTIGEKNYSAGCFSWCDKLEDVTSGSCSGFGCCQIDIPKGLKGIEVAVISVYNHTNVWQFNPCSYAFVIEGSRFNFSSSNLSATIAKTVPTAVDWAITGQGNCTEARKNESYACKENSDCYEPPDNSAGGYLCNCTEGYQGNPYISNGCKDIDECKPENHKCHYQASCVNNKGNYTCECFKGYKGDGKRDGKGCTPNQSLMTNIILGVGLGFVMLLVLSSWIYFMLRNRRLIKLKEKFFQQNGGFLLLTQLSKRSGTCDTTRIFGAEELKKATNNFDEKRIIGRGGYGTVYKGFLVDSNPVAIKKSKIVDQSQIEQFINEVTVLSQINHRNVVKLLGCCLETEVPLLVYEYVINGTLFEHIHNNDNAPTIPWETRLRIAAETAGVLSYLHSAAATPIIHRDVKSSNILLDDNFTAKVSDFGASKLVPMDVTQLSTMVQGTLGYLDPEYLHTSQLTEKSDVYSFGVVLVELITGKKVLSFDRPEEERSLVMYFLFSVKGGSLFEILENSIVNDDNKEQMTEVAELAKRCLQVKGEERPTMKEVAMELEGLRRMNKHLWDSVEVNIEETEHLLSETSYACNYDVGGNSTVAYDSMKDHTPNDTGKRGDSDSSLVLRSADEELDDDECLGHVPETSWAVPQVPSPPTTSGLYWPKNSQNQSDSAVFVPDIYCSASQNPYQYHLTGPGSKKRRQFNNYLCWMFSA